MLSGIHDAVIIYNPLAGRRRHLRHSELEAARMALREAGIVADLAATSGPGDATRLAQKAVAENRPLVMVSGGDGTVNEVVNGLACSGLPMALLPSGTANVLAKELGVPWNIRHAAKVIPRSELRRIALVLATPLGQDVAPRYFVALAGAGVDAAMVRGVELQTKLRWGMLAYWYEGFRQLFRYSFAPFRVTSAERECTATLLVVGRTRHYSGPIKLTTKADLFEGAFEMMAATTRNRWRYLRDLPILLLGQHRKISDNYYWKGTWARCEPVEGKAVYVQVDGEPLCALPVEFRIVPDALTLVVPG